MDDDLAWLNEQAEDEGVELATLVRMIVARLRKGRAPLVSMMTAPAPSIAPRAQPRPSPAAYRPREPEVPAAEARGSRIHSCTVWPTMSRGPPGIRWEHPVGASGGSIRWEHPVGSIRWGASGGSIRWWDEVRHRPYGGA